MFVWKAEEINDRAKVLPNAYEIKQVLNPPKKTIKNNSERQFNHVLLIQIIVIVVVIFGVVFIKKVNPTFHEQCRLQYKSLLRQGIDLSGQEELVKFANGVLEDVRIKTSEMMRKMESEISEENMASLGIGAGIWPTKTSEPPSDCSTESYLPIEKLTQPVVGYVVTSRYGWRTDPFTKKRDFHTGIDLAVMQGTLIFPVLPGIVQKTDYNDSYGNYVVVIHKNGLSTKYCHMQYVFVRQGQMVTTGDVIGTVGQTGAATGPHLHFELLYNDKKYNPDAALGVE